MSVLAGERVRHVKEAVDRPTLLAPDIVEAILDERQPAQLQLDDLLQEFPLDLEGRGRNTSSSP